MLISEKSFPDIGTGTIPEAIISMQEHTVANELASLQGEEKYMFVEQEILFCQIVFPTAMEALFPFLPQKHRLDSSNAYQKGRHREDWLKYFSKVALPKSKVLDGKQNESVGDSRKKYKIAYSRSAWGGPERSLHLSLTPVILNASE